MPIQKYSKIMKKPYILRSLLACFMLVATSGSIYAVTDREMEEARTIAAKAYLRFANNGSGYLDEVKATNMSDLQKVLKSKEKDNIKAFLAIPVPKDYASWDREKLIEYWAVTAMNNNNLIQDGKLAKHRIRKQIGAMQISAPSPAPAPAPDPVAAPSAEVPAASEAPSEPAATEAPVTDTNVQQDILADQKAIEADNQNPSLESGSNNTWIYVVILIILIGVVVWLVVYAAKVMKRQQISEGPEGASGAEISELRERAKRAIAQHKETIAQLTEKLQSAEAQATLAEAEAERYKEDNRRLNDRIAELQERLRNAATSSASTAPKPQPKPQPRQDEILHVIYLGRANSRGIFVRADRNYSAGNTVYRLNTEDGLTGSFEYVDNPAMNSNALEHPKEILSGGCTADDIEDTIGATGIVTESRGTAIFENGYWKVLRKSRIRFK